MTNNDILRRLRYAFDYGDDKMMAIFAQADIEVSRAQLSAWLKKDDDEDFEILGDTDLASFLNGLINEKRGKKEGAQPVPETKLTFNIIFVKLKIALNLKAEDILDILMLAEFKLGKGELSAFFRKPDHKNYRSCKEQVLRTFLIGVQRKFRPEV